MLKIKSVSSDKGEDQVRWNSWCVIKVKKNWDFLPFHKDSQCFNAFNSYTCVHLFIHSTCPLSLLYIFFNCLIIRQVVVLYLSPSHYKQLYQNKQAPYLISCSV